LNEKKLRNKFSYYLEKLYAAAKANGLKVKANNDADLIKPVAYAARRIGRPLVAPRQASAATPCVALNGSGLHIYAALAQKERALISERTKAALRAAKAQRTVLGNPRLSEAAARGTAAGKSRADQFAANLLPLERAA
jgi:hypothetical protein